MPEGGPRYDFGKFVTPGSTPKIRSIFDFSAEALEQFAFWLEQRGIHIPANQVLGFNQERQSSRVALGAVQSIPTGAETTVSFTASTYDYGMLWDNAGKLTIRQRGIYLVGGGAVFAANATGDRVVFVKKNGTTYLASSSVKPSTGGGITTDAVVASAVEMVADDYIELHVYQSSGGNLNVGPVVAGDARTNLWVTRVGT